MRKWARAAAVAGMMELVFHSRAHAEETWAEKHRIAVGGLAFAGLMADLSFTTIAARGDPVRLRWLAVTEIAVTAPQVPALLWLGIDNPLDLGTPERLLLLAASVWPAYLVGHGVWSLLVGGEQPLPTHRAATWGPTVLSDGVRLLPGVGVSGTF